MSSNFTISLLLIILGGWLMTSTLPWSVVGAIAASAGLLYMVGASLWRKWLYKYPFSKGSYWLNGERYDFKKPIKVCRGDNNIHIELTPRVKYTISEVNLRFLIDGRNAIDTTNISVTELQDKNIASPHDFPSAKSDEVGGFSGFYTPHRVVSKGDVVKYTAKFIATHQWRGKLELSLRITAEEFGRYPARFECTWQPK